MSIVEQLSSNKGTVSSALSKTLAQQVLDGRQTAILMECIDLASYEASSPRFKQVRSGAAKVVEIVAEKRPELVAPHLHKLLPALAVEEPQTRWMIIRTMGFCAHLNKPIAQQAVAFAGRYVDAKEGLCLSSSADLFLGDFGAISTGDAQAVFPILERSLENALTNEQDWLLEAFTKVLPNLGEAERARVLEFADRWKGSPRLSTQQRAKKILKWSR